MSITLFYGGLGCVVIGAAGLITLLVLFLRNRRVDQRDHLIEEIELAENRAPAGPPRHQQPTPQRPAAPQTSKTLCSRSLRRQSPPRSNPPPAPGPSSPRRPPSTPRNSPLPEIPKPQAQRPAAPQASKGPLQRQPAQNQPASGTGPIVPQEASLYTEEFHPPGDPKAPGAAARPANPAPQPTKATDPPSSSTPTRSSGKCCARPPTTTTTTTKAKGAARLLLFCTPAVGDCTPGAGQRAAARCAPLRGRGAACPAPAQRRGPPVPAGPQYVTGRKGASPARGGPFLIPLSQAAHVAPGGAGGPHPGPRGPGPAAGPRRPPLT